MNAGKTALATLAATAMLIAAAAAVLRARDRGYYVPEPTERLLYLRSGSTANRVFLSFDAMAADIYWIRSIQNYGRDRTSDRSDRFQLLYPLLDLTTTLDPYFNIAYRFGAILLAVEEPQGPGRPDLAIKLLLKGLEKNPRWQYPYDIGFVHYWYTNDYQEAARWFERAAAMPRAPEWIRPLAAITMASGGDRQSARRMLNELLSSTEQYIRQTAQRDLLKLDALDTIDRLNAVLDEFNQKNGRYPTDLDELVRARVLTTVPVDPSGEPFAYDPITHAINLSPTSKIGALPKKMNSR